VDYVAFPIFPFRLLLYGHLQAHLIEMRNAVFHLFTGIPS
jgi:hypothetical protein